MQALGSFLVASRLEPEDAATYELLHSAVDEAKEAHIDVESDCSGGSHGPRDEALSTRCGASRTNDSETFPKQLRRIEEGVASMNDSMVEGDYSDPDSNNSTAMDCLYSNPDETAKAVDLLAVSGPERTKDMNVAEHAADRLAKVNLDGGVESRRGFEHHGESMCDVPERGLWGASVLIAAADTSRKSMSPSEHNAASVLKPEDMLLSGSDHGPGGRRDVRVNSSGGEKRVVELVNLVSSPERDFPDGEVEACLGNIDGVPIQTAQQVSGPEENAHALSWSMDMVKERAKEVAAEESLQTVEIEKAQSVHSEDPLITSIGETFPSEGFSNEDPEPSTSVSLVIDENKDAVSPGRNEFSTPFRYSGSASLVNEKYGETSEISVEGDLMLNANAVEPEGFSVGEAVPATGVVADVEYSKEYSSSEDIDMPKDLANVETTRVEGQEEAERVGAHSTEEERLSADAAVQEDGMKSYDISVLDVTPEEVVPIGGAMTGDAKEIVGEEGDGVTVETKDWTSPITEEGEEIDVRMDDAGVGLEDEIASRKDLESEAAAETRVAGQGQKADADSTPSGASDLSVLGKTLNKLEEGLSEQVQGQRSANDSNSIPDAAGLVGTEGGDSALSPSASGSTSLGGGSAGDVDGLTSIMSMPQALRDVEVADSLPATTEDLVEPLNPSSGGEVVGVGQEERTPEKGPGRVGDGGSSATAVADDKVGTSTGGAEDVGGSVGAEGSKVQVSVETGSVPEEEARRARSKAKLGLARLQQGQTKKALNLFQNVATIDPEWWGGFYYTALGKRPVAIVSDPVAICSR